MTGAMTGATTMMAPILTRVSLREIREVAFRALVAAGASTGQADTAATQVLDAELHHGTGLRDLLADLRLGPWRDDPVPVREAGGMYVVGDGPTDALRIGIHLVELATSRPEVPTARSAARLPLTPLLDALLLQAACLAEHPVAAATAIEAAAHVRVATPTGDIGWGGAAIVMDVPPIPTGTLAVLLAGPVDRGKGQWHTSADREARRRTAATEGVRVDTAVWKAAHAASRRYLVPEA